MEFRERLYQLRKGRGISQEELAHTVGVSRQAYRSGRRGNPKLKEIAPMLTLLTPRFSPKPTPRRASERQQSPRGQIHKSLPPTGGGLRRSVPTLFPALLTALSLAPAPSVAGHPCRKSEHRHPLNNKKAA